MKIIFMGTPHFAVASLNKLLQNGYDVAAVVTVPDKPQGRGRVLKPSPVKEFAASHDIPVLQPQSLKDLDFIQNLKKFKAELYIVVAFRILPEAVFTIPERGTLNVHGSLLPKYRGAAPINRVIMNGDKESGVTTMLIDKKVDTGQMLLQDSAEISEDMTAGELHDILAEKGANLLVETLEKLENSSITPIVQDDSLATKAPKIKKEDCKLDFSNSARQLHNQIRGLSPVPAAYCQFRGKNLKIYRSALTNGERLKDIDINGEIITVNKNSFDVVCSQGTILTITELQPAGKKRIPARDFINGYQLRVGDRLE
jgi:methionyl-tRNA formyltransferase